MPDVLGYARVSTRDQDLEVQRRRLLGEGGAIKVFEDTISGKRFDRPGLAEMLDFSRPGDTICVVRLDRLGRSLKELLETIELFKSRGLAFRSLEEGLDTGSAAGELVFHVFGAIAHFERRLIVERTQDGIAAARARGKVPGRPPLDAETRASALKLIEAGVRPAQAAKQLGLGRSTIYRELALMRGAPADVPNPV
ncbi:recombinase family protein [Sphingomonas elodea]|uniref:recombinase family protein n=1 Tax=Sphingomonas elodea TaxID=179878 RepID=UPI0002630A72|nr:recombinase family protein [Sphingomonas elodea]